MLDLETVDTAPTSAIVSIGAVYFCPETKKLGREFYQPVNVNSCYKLGLTKSEKTLDWWQTQSVEARRVFIDNDRVNLGYALNEFSVFTDKGCYVWGNGAAFDNAILANAYNVLGLATPWKFYNDRCYRTIRTLLPESMDRIGIHHNALDDAKTQATHLMNFGAVYVL